MEQISQIHPAYVSPLDAKLHDYQRIAKNFIMTHPKSGLFLDVGFGKTLITLSALLDLAMLGQISGHILIIAPKAVARSTWLDEMKKWNINANTVSLIINDKGKQLTKAKRIARYEEIASHPSAFYFINRELIADLVKWHSDNKRPWPFPTVVIDELHSFKSHSSQRFKAIKSVSGCISRLIGLTGTPKPNSLMDLWSQIYLMDGGQRLGKNITEYRNTFFYPGLAINGVTVKWNPKQGAEDEIYNRIKDLVISVKNPNIILPSITYNDINCYMSNDETDVYKSFVRDRVMTVTDNNGNESVAKASNAGVLVSRLSQMASGTIYINDTHEYIPIHQRKLEQLEYIINNTGSPILVAYFFKSDLDQITKYMKNAQIPTELFDGSSEMQARWNNGMIPVMLMQPASTGCGVNIQYGGHTLVWYTLPTSLEQYIQTNGRLARQGQNFPVMIHHLLTFGTIDRHNLHNLEKKDISEQALKAAVAATVDDIAMIQTGNAYSA